MFPLLKKDRLILPYFVVWFMWNWMGSFVQRDVKPVVLRYISWVMTIIFVIFKEKSDLTFFKLHMFQQ